MLCLADRRTVRRGGRRWTIPIPFTNWELFKMRPNCLISWGPLELLHPDKGIMP
jgi:hypothetical protein